MHLTMSLQYDYDLPEVAHEDRPAETRTDTYQLQAKPDVKFFVKVLGMLFRLCATLVVTDPKYRRYYTPAQIGRAIRILIYHLECDNMKHWRKATTTFENYGNRYPYKRVAEASKILERALNAVLPHHQQHVKSLYFPCCYSEGWSIYFDQSLPAKHYRLTVQVTASRSVVPTPSTSVLTSTSRLESLSLQRFDLSSKSLICWFLRGFLC